MKLWTFSIGCNLRFGNLFLSTFIIYIHLGLLKIGQQTKVLTFIKKTELTTLKNVTSQIIHVGIFKKHVGNFHTRTISAFCLYFANLDSFSIETTKLNFPIPGTQFGICSSNSTLLTITSLDEKKEASYPKKQIE